MTLIKNRFMKTKSHISIHIQDTLHKQKKLKLHDCYNWLGSVSNKKAEITVRVVTEKESRTLNKQYRKIDENYDTGPIIKVLPIELHEPPTVFHELAAVSYHFLFILFKETIVDIYNQKFQDVLQKND